MKINPNLLNRVDGTTAPLKTDKSFGDALTDKAEQPLGPSNTSPLTGLAQGVSKTDLADAPKADAIVKQAVNELLAKEFGNMSSPDREQVGAWLNKDPIVRAALWKHINSLAS